MMAKMLDVAREPELAAAVRLLDSTMRDESGGRELLLVRDGDTIFAIVALDSPVPEGKSIPAGSWPLDVETIKLSFSPEFRAMIDEARRQADQGLGIPADEVRRRLGITDEEREKYLRRGRKTKARP